MIRIKLNKKIYSCEAVGGTVKAFKKFAGLKIEENAQYFLIEAKNVAPGLENIFLDEFCNFALSAMNG